MRLREAANMRLEGLHGDSLVTDASVAFSLYWIWPVTKVYAGKVCVVGIGHEHFGKDTFTIVCEALPQETTISGLAKMVERMISSEGLVTINGDREDIAA